MESEQATPLLSQTQRLKEFSQEGRLSLDVMRAIMLVCRVVKTRDFMIMSKHHLKNKNLLLEAKGFFDKLKAK